MSDREPPSLFIDRINNKGTVEVTFTEPLVNVRNLTTINETALHLEIIPGYDDYEMTDMSKLAFTWNVTYYSERKMTIQLEFEDPIYVSIAEASDVLFLRVLDMHPFVSKTSFNRIPEGTESYSIIPAQMANNLVTEALEASTAFIDITSQTAIASNFIINIFLAGALSYLWGLIHCL